MPPDTWIKWKCCVYLLLLLQLVNVPTLTTSSNASPRQLRTREGFAISPRTCEVASEHGTCMFVWECLKTDGKHLGMCMDGFMFGSCCVHNADQIDRIGTANDAPVVVDLINVVDDTDYSDKYKPSTPSPSVLTTTTTTTTTTFDMIEEHRSDFWTSSDRPTRPSRPTKPTVRWPSFHAVQSSDSSGNRDDSPSEKLTVHFPHHVADRPTKSPPPLLSSSTTKKAWAWKEQTSLTTITSTVTVSTTSQRLSVSTDADVTNTTDDYSQVKGLLSRPTRPTRPPKPSTYDLVTYFPPQNDVQPAGADSSILKAEVSSATSTTSPTTASWSRPPATTETMTKVEATLAITTLSPPLRTSTKIESSSVPAQPILSPPMGACGVPVAKSSCPKGRIVNGTQSCYGQFPWQVSVRRTSFFGFSSTHRCGGALVNELWVATAGHCVDDLLLPKIRIRIGEWDFSSTSEPHGHVERKVVKKIVHPKYNFFTYEYDLALVKLDKGVDFKENIIPICLPGNDDLLIGETGIVAGWGRLSEGGQLPSILQYVTVPIVSNERCKEMFLKAGRHEVIPDIFMCAGYDLGGRDSCQGDSGGPLVVKGKDGRYFLGGIISWGIGCAEPNLPGVCTRISKFTDWILSNVT